MANTRFNYDEARTIKKLQESLDIEKYALYTPGNGRNPTYISDIHILPQKWGGNLVSDPIRLESELQRSAWSKGDYVKSKIGEYAANNYPVDNSKVTRESRYITPAWEVRNIPIDRMDYLPTDPQLHSMITFPNNIDTRNTVKDYYLYKV